MLLCCTTWASPGPTWESIECPQPTGTLVLGRQPGQDGRVLEEPSAIQGLLSRRHCSLQTSPDGQLIVTDLGSLNGTFVQLFHEDGQLQEDEEQQWVKLPAHVPTPVASGCMLYLGGKDVVRSSDNKHVSNPFAFIYLSTAAQEEVALHAQEPKVGVGWGVAVVLCEQ